jgi:PAS domain-containing protein
MNQFFRTQYSQEDLQQQLAERRRQNAPSRTASMSMMASPVQQQTDDTMDITGTMGGETLDDIIMQNNRELQRRQSLPQGYAPHDIDRRSSMMEFGSSNANLNGFQFGPTTTNAGDQLLRRQSTGELEMGGGYPDMASGMHLQNQQMGFSSSMQGSVPLTIDTSSGYPGMPPDMMQNMMGYAPMVMEGIAEEDPNMSMFSPTFSQPYGGGSMGSMSNDFMMAPSMPDGLPPLRDSMQVGDENENEMMASMPGLGVSDNTLVDSPQNLTMAQSIAAYSSPVIAQMPPAQESSFNIAPPPTVPTTAPEATSPLESEVVVKQEKTPNYEGIYSSSGFDMLKALMKVAMRKDPEIVIGKVDLSCAFVVCDVTQHDMPIIYVSEIFERLTGYSKFEVKGQNCRFLQSPEGKIEAGAKRNFVNNNDVYYLKQRLEARKEAQRSLINYRKGGQPFMNLLTMIPITGEDDKEIKYYVGFQVDVVAKPSSLECQDANGKYTVDYDQSQIPRYTWQPPQAARNPDGGQTISRDDVSTVLQSINNNSESELTKRMWDKVLLENTDDVVHVLSLKGLFLYLSPSSRQVLEYDSSELVGTALSSVCHPSDIVPVTRELKDTSTGASVNVVFRIRRKRSGYTWFESHGSLCVEQGKGRKCIILVGRERPVYALARHDIEAAGGIGESEIWTKLSTSGMFLFVSSNVRTLLDRSPEDLVGTSIQTLMRAESKVEFGRSLERARTGKRVTHKHEVLNKRGLVLQAQTTLYPGDAVEGQKPTFLVAQTRLLKNSSRAVAPAPNTRGDSSNSISTSSRIENQSEDSTAVAAASMSSGPTQSLTPRSSASVPGPITQAGGSGLTIGTQDIALASEDNIFDELKTTRCTSWQFELRQMEKCNRLLAEELAALLSNKKKRKRRKGAGHLQRDCANCHTRVTPEWRRGPSGQRDLCNSCGLRWAKEVSRSDSEQKSGTVRQTSKGWSQSDSSTSRS